MAEKPLLYVQYIVHGVREIPYHTGFIVEKVSRGQRPHYYTLYGIMAEGYEMAIADFKKRSDAEALKKELNRLLKFYRSINKD